jgi:hypothetical protein
MAEDRNWAHHAQAEALRAEVDLLRGAVAALRATRPPTPPPAHESASRGWALVLLAFAFGALATLVLLAFFPQAICP